MKHDLIKTGDADSFRAIEDRNGEVALNYCRRCGKGEAELTADNCIFTADGLTDYVIRKFQECARNANEASDAWYALYGAHLDLRTLARKRIAEILNARAEGSR